MFCPKCGKELNDGALFCGSCGEPVGSAPTSPASAGVGGAAPAAVAGAGASAAGAMKTKRSKMPFIAGGAALAVLVVVLVVVFVVKPFGGGHSTAADLLDDCERIVNDVVSNELTTDSIKKATDELMGCMPPGAADALIERSGYSSLDEALGVAFSEMSDEELAQANSMLSLVAIDTAFSTGTYLDAFSISELEGQISSYGISCDVQEACLVQGMFTITGAEGSEYAGMTETLDFDDMFYGSAFFAVKVDGSWYLWIGEELDSN